MPHVPVFPGYIGFTFYKESWLSRAIAYFSRWGRGKRSICSHTLIVSGPDECIEAHINYGVQRSSLTKYRDDPKCRIIFLIPNGWTPELGNRIVRTAAKYIGDPYDTRLIASQLLANTMLGHWLNRVSRGWLDKHISRVLNRRRREICSELVAIALRAQPEFSRVDLLRRPARMISPQALISDPELFGDDFLT